MGKSYDIEDELFDQLDGSSPEEVQTLLVAVLGQLAEGARSPGHATRFGQMAHKLTLVQTGARPILDEVLAARLRDGVKMMGTYQPEEVLCYIEEQLTGEEWELAYAFLNWVTREGKSFGDNLPRVFAEFAHLSEKKRKEYEHRG